MTLGPKLLLLRIAVFFFAVADNGARTNVALYRATAPLHLAVMLPSQRHSLLRAKFRL